MILARLEASEWLAKSQVANDIEGRVIVPSYSVKCPLTTFTFFVQLPDKKVHVADDYRLLLSHYTDLSVYSQKGIKGKKKKKKKKKRKAVVVGQAVTAPSRPAQQPLRGHQSLGSRPPQQTLGDLIGRSSTYYSGH